MKEKMVKFVLERYPRAAEFRYTESKWGCELQFLPNSHAMDCFSCVFKNGRLQILKEF